MLCNRPHRSKQAKRTGPDAYRATPTGDARGSRHQVPQRVCKRQGAKPSSRPPTRTLKTEGDVMGGGGETLG